MISKIQFLHLLNVAGKIAKWGGKSNYEIGTGFGHIAINVADVYQATAVAKEQGAEVIREAGAMNAGNTIVKSNGFIQVANS
jgi:4-hydroxyphenylpyruvate dioxygenase-like putative hemolysin